MKKNSHRSGVRTRTAIYWIPPSHGIHNADPSTIWDRKIQASGQEQLSEQENHVIEDRYGTSRGPLALLGSC